MSFGDYKDYTLRSIHFHDGVSVVVGGKYAAMTYWDLVQFPDVLIEERENGDYWFVTPWDGRMRVVSKGDIAWRLFERAGTEQSKVEPALAKRRDAEKMYADKFGPKQPIKGTGKP